MSATHTEVAQHCLTSITVKPPNYHTQLYIKILNLLKEGTAPLIWKGIYYSQENISSNFRVTTTAQAKQVLPAEFPPLDMTSAGRADAAKAEQMA